VDDLVYGMADSSEHVRNNAMRALAMFGEMVPVANRPVPRIPASRDASLLVRLRKDALVPLIEMARRKSDGHARPAFDILARMAGYSDDAAKAAWDRDERELVISAALRRQ
jgi:hypothetical protein